MPPFELHRDTETVRGVPGAAIDTTARFIGDAILARNVATPRVE